MTADLAWTFEHWEALTPSACHHILKLRQSVFVLEQACLYPDIDDQDLDWWHLCGWHNKTLVAYARLRCDASPTIIGRVAVHPDYRGLGIGKALMQNAMARSTRPIEISAQHYLLAFYTALGFEAKGEPYDEDGIPHIAMTAP
ncbi:MAG: GNAT family N-acetyltransferase [Gammaproteobacteria bacterium]|nr:GNAT family N-acetyltransferase [Gammaproteobacteria bacterium]